MHADICGIRIYNMRLSIYIFITIFALCSYFFPIQTMIVTLLGGLALSKSLMMHLKDYYSDKKNIKDDLLFPFIPTILMFISFLFGGTTSITFIRWIDIDLMHILYNYLTKNLNKS